MDPGHDGQQQRREKAGEKDAVEEVGVELHDLCLALLEDITVGQALVFLRAGVVAGPEGFAGAGRERLELEARVAGDAVGLAIQRIRLRVEFNALDVHARAGLVGREDQGEELVLHRGPDEGGRFLDERRRGAILQADPGQDAAAFQVAAPDESDILTVRVACVKIETEVIFVERSRGAEVERGARQGQGLVGQVAERRFVADLVIVLPGGLGQ